MKENSQASTAPFFLSITRALKRSTCSARSRKRTPPKPFGGSRRKIQKETLWRRSSQGCPYPCKTTEERLNMKDCNKDIENYHSDKVKLGRDKCKELTDRRDANRTRVKDGLKKTGDPQPEEFVTQGSRAMDTTTQEPNNAYDIDDGAVFPADTMVGSNGAEKSALDARKMVRDAVDDGSFKTKP